jgi:hypothetical protein
MSDDEFTIATVRRVVEEHECFFLDISQQREVLICNLITALTKKPYRCQLP